MTPSSTPVRSLVHRQLLAEARDDIHGAMARAVPFVLSHPDQAGVLSELGAIASASGERDLEVFRSVVAALVGAAARAEESQDPPGSTQERSFDVAVVGGATRTA